MYEMSKRKPDYYKLTSKSIETSKGHDPFASGSSRAGMRSVELGAATKFFASHPNSRLGAAPKKQPAR
jgi:hypothetical protein